MHLLLKILFAIVGLATKQLCCKALNEKYGAKSVKNFYIFSLFIGGYILYCIWGISSEDLLFSIPNSFAWGFMFGSIDINPLKCNKD
ncbi:hypothetical protein [Maledivibacter halophilus]|uniref:Uncharacterized protein n=1 Tax=Maledivibacter halophilus TaxID=36842 RepID=A0A1T5KZ57_9FIRM|nr:hypothetical protein [Maledivibacter halophilus]SKC68659.1 hypothetical protein SAMN02194393_02172 [Maledivibacter halophilus]